MGSVLVFKGARASLSSRQLKDNAVKDKLYLYFRGSHKYKRTGKNRDSRRCVVVENG